MSVDLKIDALPQTAGSSEAILACFRPLHHLKTAARHSAGWVGGWAAAWVHHMTPGGQGLGRGAPIRPLNMEKIDPRDWPLSLGSYMYEVGWGKSIFFWFPLLIFARRGDSGRPRGCPKGLGGRHPDLGGSPVEIPWRSWGGLCSNVRDARSFVGRCGNSNGQ